jgi:CBS domain-containing protein
MKTVHVAQVSEISDLQALVVRGDMPLAEAIQQFAHNHDLRGIFLTDEDGRLTGVVNKRDLLDWVSVQMDQPPAGQPLTIGQMRRLVGAQRVGDLAAAGSAGAAVRLDETLAEALQRMTYYGLTDGPVIDQHGRIVNDLRLSEILAYMLEHAD